MDFKNTVLSAGSLTVIGHTCKHSLPTLLSAARSEYLNTGSLAGPFMSQVADLFNVVAKHAYAAAFIWSAYNLDRWKKFVASESSSPEGGSCVFSCEPDGDYRREIHHSFRALFVGTPTGMHPYALSVTNGISKMDTDSLRLWLVAEGHVTA